MEMTVDALETQEKYSKLNVFTDDHARFKELAAKYSRRAGKVITMAELFSGMVDALEADLAGRKPEA